MSGQMLPSYIINNTPDGMLLYLKMSSKFALAYAFLVIHTTNLKYFVICQFCSIVSHSRMWRNWFPMSRPQRVPDVISLGSSIKMGWIHANTIIAFMANIKSIGDWSISKFIRDTMCQICSLSIANTSISMCGRYLPRPTRVGSIRFVNIFPKFFRERLTCSVSQHKAARLALFCLTAGRRISGDCSLLSTTALTVSIRNCIKRIICDMMLHVDSLLGRFSAMHPDADNIAGVLCCSYFTTSPVLVQIARGDS